MISLISSICSFIAEQTKRVLCYINLFGQHWAMENTLYIQNGVLWASLDCSNVEIASTNVYFNSCFKLCKKCYCSIYTRGGGGQNYVFRHMQKADLHHIRNKQIICIPICVVFVAVVLVSAWYCSYIDFACSASEIGWNVSSYNLVNDIYI